VVWRNGCYDQEGTLDNYWRWCGSKGTIELVNRTDRTLELNLETLLTADNGGDLKLTSSFFQEKLSIDRLGRLFTKSITLPPGHQSIEFECNAERVLPPNDFRELVFQMRNFKLAPVEQGR
jgi:hypothetical protein